MGLYKTFGRVNVALTVICTMMVVLAKPVHDTGVRFEDQNGCLLLIDNPSVNMALGDTSADTETFHTRIQTGFPTGTKRRSHKFALRREYGILCNLSAEETNERLFSYLDGI